MNPSTTEQTLETIEAMRRQEEHYGYCVTDYLSELTKTTTATDIPVDASCRLAMAQWCNQIANICNYKRDTVAIAMNCLDRFMATPSGQEILLDRNLYQLAAMTALYSSVKIHEQEVMDTNLVSNLSKGVHTPAVVEAMESKMLMAIQWRVNPPTAMSFMRMISDLIPDTSLDCYERQIILDKTRQQIEMTVSEYNFCSFDASSIAFASMLNSIESICLDSGNDEFYTNFNMTIGTILAVDGICIDGLRNMIYKHMEENDINIGIVQQCSDNVTKKSISYTDDDVNNTAVNENSQKSSPRTVRISVANNAA